MAINSDSLIRSFQVFVPDWLIGQFVIHAHLLFSFDEETIFVVDQQPRQQVSGIIGPHDEDQQVASKPNLKFLT